MPPKYSLTGQNRRDALLKSLEDGHLVVRGDQECLVSFLHTLILEGGLNVGGRANEAHAYQILLEVDPTRARAELQLGGNDADGRLTLFGKRQTVSSEGGQTPDPPTVEIRGASGDLFLRPVEGKKTAWLSSKGRLFLGGNAVDGGLLLFPARHENSESPKNATVQLAAGSGALVLSLVDGQGAVKDTIWLAASSASLKAGGNGANGDLRLFPAQAEQFGGAASVALNAGTGSIDAGGNDTTGTLDLLSRTGKVTAHLDAEGTLVLGGKGPGGDLLIYPSWGNAAAPGNNAAAASVHIDGQTGTLNLRGVANRIRDSIRLEGTEGCIKVGGNGVSGKIEIFAHSSLDFGGAPAVTIDGGAGDIILTNADCAEEFTVAAGQAVEPGMVLVFDDEGTLRPCEKAYDSRVAGVVAGGGSCRPGMILGHQPGAANRRPIALSGKVFCRVDAEDAAIRTGDLLTTAPRPGHAMRAADPGKAFGAVIGKAMCGLEAGCGLIPILVALQ
jgi:hypothetical protein